MIKLTQPNGQTFFVDPATISMVLPVIGDEYAKFARCIIQVEGHRQAVCESLQEVMILKGEKI